MSGSDGNPCFCIRRLAGWRAVANPSERGGRPSGGPDGRGGGIPVIRALLVLILFVVVTVLVLSDIHPTTKTPSGSAAPPTTTTTTTKSAHPPPPTTTTTIPPSKVPVLVANASGINGAAAAVSSQLQPGGWDLLPPTNASTRSRRRTCTTWPGSSRSGPHRLVAAAPGHLGGSVHHRGADQLHRHGRGGGGRRPRARRQDHCRPPQRPPQVERRPTVASRSGDGPLPSPDARRSLRRCWRSRPARPSSPTTTGRCRRSSPIPARPEPSKVLPICWPTWPGGSASWPSSRAGRRRS